MKNFYYEGTRYKNGSIHLRFSPDEIEKSKDSEHMAVSVVMWKLDSLDCQLKSESYESLGNSGWYLRLHCWNNGSDYYFTNRDIEMLLDGKTVILLPRAAMEDETDGEEE